MHTTQLLERPVAPEVDPFGKELAVKTGNSAVAPTVYMGDATYSAIEGPRGEEILVEDDEEQDSSHAHFSNREETAPFGADQLTNVSEGVGVLAMADTYCAWPDEDGKMIAVVDDGSADDGGK